MNWRRDLVGLALVFGTLYFFLLGRAPLANPDEGRYAEIPREMVASGDWTTPRLDGIAYFEKPPLMYWAVAACLECLGPGEGSVRAAPALFGLGGVLLAYAAGRRLFGRDAGAAAGIVLGSSLLYFALSRLLILDMAVSVLMSAALVCFILGVREPAGSRRRWLFYGLYASAALATLAKGLVGVLLPGAVMFLWLLVFNQWRRLRPLHLPTGAALFLAVAAPWHVLVAESNPAWARFYFIHEHWERFTTTAHGRAGPWWYFAPVVLVGLFPWVGFLWQAIREALAGGWARRRENADSWFLAVWAAVVFLFFSKSQSKLMPYILPVFPPLAVLIGAWLARALRERPGALRPGIRAGLALCVLLGAAAGTAAGIPAVLRDPTRALALRPFCLAGCGVLLAGAAATAWLGRRRGPVAGLGTLFATALAFYFVLVAAAPAIDGRSTKPLAIDARVLAAPGDRIYHYHEFFHDFTFYAGREVRVVAFKGELEPENDPRPEAAALLVDERSFRAGWAGPGRAFAVVPANAIGELFSDPSFHYRLLALSRGRYLLTNQP